MYLCMRVHVHVCVGMCTCERSAAARVLRHDHRRPRPPHNIVADGAEVAAVLGVGGHAVCADHHHVRLGGEGGVGSVSFERMDGDTATGGEANARPAVLLQYSTNVDAVLVPGSFGNVTTASPP